MPKITKNHKKFAALLASFLLHFLLILAIYFSVDSKEKIQPPVTLEIELITLGKENLQKQKSEKLRLKKQTHEASDHVHLPEEVVEKSGAQHATKNLEPTFRPLPEIPQDLRSEAFSSEAVARFYVTADGEVSQVELIRPCANPKLNSLLLKTLKRWKFSPSNSASTQDIRVNFSVR